jgi:mannose-6-phosphate isomerase-like protein (cupin superfamily)
MLRLAIRTTIGICTAGVVFACVATPVHAQAPLHSTVFPADSARSRKSTPANTQRSIVDTLTATLAKLEMHETTVPAGGAPHAPHRHIHEELLVIRTGVMEVLQGTVTRMAKPGDVVFMASNEWHGLKNPGTTPATYLVIRIDPHDIPPNGTSSTVPPAAAAAPR